MKECMVSIICVTYNQKDYLGKALDSFLSQKTDVPFEIIVHDDIYGWNNRDIKRLSE